MYSISGTKPSCLRPYEGQPVFPDISRTATAMPGGSDQDPGG